MPNTRKKILIIEDEKFLLSMLREKLVMDKFDVLEATDGDDGLAAAFKNHPDLILLDVIMPKMNGLAVLDNLRKDTQWGKDVPVILLTNLADSEMQALAEKQNVEDYLVKADWSLDELTRKIKDKLGL